MLILGLTRFMTNLGLPPFKEAIVKYSAMRKFSNLLWPSDSKLYALMRKDNDHGILAHVIIYVKLVTYSINYIICMQLQLYAQDKGNNIRFLQTNTFLIISYIWVINIYIERRSLIGFYEDEGRNIRIHDIHLQKKCGYVLGASPG